jgi:hypothetical protein
MHIHYWTQTKEIDLACAITAGAEMGASPKGSADHTRLISSATLDIRLFQPTLT